MRWWEGTAAEVGKWRTVGTRVVLDEEWLHVRADECVTSEGVRVSPYFVIEYPDWVHIVALNGPGSVLVLCQYRHGAGIVSAEFPAGTIAPGDTSPLRAAQRELQEETGYVADRWDQIGTVFANPANQTNRVHSFLARGLRWAGAETDEPTEVVRGRFFSWAEVVALHESGLFVQALHLGTMFQAFRSLGMLASPEAI